MPRPAGTTTRRGAAETFGDGVDTLSTSVSAAVLGSRLLGMMRSNPLAKFAHTVVSPVIPALSTDGIPRM